MAKIPIAEVKQVWRDNLAALAELNGVNLHAAWPGDNLLYAQVVQTGKFKSAVWFGPSVPSYERHSMRADRQRRLVTVNFHVMIEVLVAGEENLQDGSVPNAALQAESYAYDLWQPIDEHVADDKHLSSPTLVDSAVVDGDETTAGFTDTGYGYRLAMPIIAKFRLL